MKASLSAHNKMGGYLAVALFWLLSSHLFAGPDSEESVQNPGREWIGKTLSVSVADYVPISAFRSFSWQVHTETEFRKLLIEKAYLYFSRWDSHGRGLKTNEARASDRKMFRELTSQSIRRLARLVSVERDLDFEIEFFEQLTTMTYEDFSRLWMFAEASEHISLRDLRDAAEFDTEAANKKEIHIIRIYLRMILEDVYGRTLAVLEEKEMIPRASIASLVLQSAPACHMIPARQTSRGHLTVVPKPRGD